MRHQYAVVVYFLIIGNLCLGDLLMPLFPMVLPVSRSSNRSSVSGHTAFVQAFHSPTTSFSCAEETKLVPDDPQLAHDLMAVFGTDTLWQRAQQPQPVKKLGKNNKHHSQQKLATANPLSASWSTISSLLPFSNDLDLGANSDTDIYIQFLAKKNWALPLGLQLNTAQIFRYGSSSKNYAETNLDLTQKLQHQNQLSSQFNVSKTQDTDYSWSNRTFQQLHFLSQDKLSYGIFSTGEYENRELRVNEWGPYFSWRRPIWRNWIFMQNDLNYLNIPATRQADHFSYQMSFEAQF
ncbi:selenocysteine synthase [Acinetobacter courvalinii]|uniref:selenocysteine synthase n=1 Tax=Acinetobacter courvalinii TaxID=280147 RepID=UPI0019022275|nr:selenocysteine synthase [Acinetobacter courvalinii]MBJ8419244.1 selenocysteine synthase [Acinetobacter courvalinii]